MGFFELFLLAVGLSMDAFAVSICKGLAMKKADAKGMAICGVWFGGFQALMPTIGFFLGTLFAEAIQAIDHWVAFILLGIIGINMLKEAFEKRGKIDGTTQIDLNFFMIYYVFPAILMTEHKNARLLADVLCEKWGMTFKNSKIGYTDYDTLYKSFREKIFGIF